MKFNALSLSLIILCNSAHLTARIPFQPTNYNRTRQTTLEQRVAIAEEQPAQDLTYAALYIAILRARAQNQRATQFSQVRDEALVAFLAQTQANTNQNDNE
jgi:hypothetical protein